jgi:hypothetical protein
MSGRELQPVRYSSRKALTGSTRAAERAGKYDPSTSYWYKTERTGSARGIAHKKTRSSAS